MANESNRYTRQPDRERDRNRSYTRQQEQFEDSSWRDEDRQQMGEVRNRDRDDDGQFDLGRRSTNRERGHRSSFETGPASGQQGYSSSSYGPHYYGNREGRGFRSFTGSDFGGADFAGPQRAYGAAPRREYGYGDRSERGFFERAGDEVASWFGDEDAARRREQDHRGHGPAGYTRSDERIREDASDKLTEDWRVDARAIEVGVVSGEVTLDGSVPSREQKRRAEDLVDSLSGVKHVQNNLRVNETSTWDRNNSGETSKS